jgi:PAS domain-containing protein
MLDVTLEQIHQRAQDLRRQRETATDERGASTSCTESEFEALVSEFRTIWNQIKQHDEELDHLRQHLEHEVSRRTAELREANRSLASAYAEMELFWSSIPSIVIGIDANGGVTRWNAAAADAFGLKDSRRNRAPYRGVRNSLVTTGHARRGCLLAAIRNASHL